MSRESFHVPPSESDRNFKSEIDDFWKSKDEEVEKLPRGLGRCEDFIGDTEEVYDNYSAAMFRRDREPLKEDRFVDHFFEGNSLDDTFMFGDSERGYLLGFMKTGAFIPTHFAPSSLRGGYRLLEDLGGRGDVPVITSITPDLAKTLRKMDGWNFFEVKIPAEFRGEPTEKIIAYNSHPENETIINKFLSDYLKEKSGLPS